MKPFSIYLFVFLFVLPQTVSADDCAIVEGDVNTLFEFYKTKCPDKKGDDLCACLREQAKDNVLIAQQFATKTDLEENNRLFILKQTQRLFKIYKQMTYDSEYQKKMLNLKTTSTVGCPAEDLRASFQEGVKEFTLKKLNEKKVKQEEDLAQCGKSTACQELNLKLKATNTEIANVDQIVGEACGRLTNAVVNITNEAFDVPAVQDLLKARRWYIENKPMEPKKIQEIDAVILKIRTSSAQPKNFVAPSACARNEASPIYESLISTYHQDLKNSLVDISNQAKVIAVQRKSDSSIGTDYSEVLVKSIDAFNTSVENKFKNKFDHVGPNSCYTFSEYKIWKSRPSDALLDALSNSTDPSKFFQPTGDFTNKLEVEKINYLRANPAIANTLSVTCAGPQFGFGMQRFAEKVKGKDDKDKLREYIKFMKEEGAQLLQETEVLEGQRHNCDMLGRNIAAVFLTDEPAPVPQYNTSNAFQMLSQQVLVCKTNSTLKKSTTNLSHTLLSNPLYLVQNGNSINPATEEPDSDLDYQNFLKEHCADFSEYRDRKIKECLDPADLNNCKAASEDALQTAELREKYFAEYSKKSHVMGPMVAGNINATMTPEQHKNVSNINRLEKQDPVIRERYEKHVKPNLKTPVIALRGRESEYTQAVANDRAVVERSATIPYTPSETIPSVAATEPIPAVVAEPDWSQAVMPVVTPSELASTELTSLLPTNYPTQAPEQKLETIKEARANVLSESDKRIAATEDPIDKQKIINDLRSSIANFDKEADKIKATIQAPLPVTQTNSNVVSAGSNPTNNSQSSGGYSGSGTGTITPSGVAGSFSKRIETASEKTNAAYLKSKYAESEKLANRGPASIADESAKIVLGPSMTGVLDANASIFSHVPMDAANFKDGNFILSRVKTELENKKVKKDGNVLIQFYDKTKNEVLVVNVVWQNNQWVISQVPRKSMLSNLNLTLISQVNQ